MKYENAKNLLPQELLEQVQRYAGGKVIYIPIAGSRKPWGERTGNRYLLSERNKEIRRKFESGSSFDDLSREYFLTPETIRNIVYLRKEERKMTVESIFKLYSDETPVSSELKFEMDEEKEWGEYYFLRDYTVTYPSRKLDIHIHRYPFTSENRVKQQPVVIEAYRRAGVESCRIIPNRYGELCRTVAFEGHSCVVYAEETPESTLAANDNSPKDKNGRLIYSDELISAMAKVGEMHLSGDEPSFDVLFDSSSCAVKQYEDWIDEYTELDLPKKINEQNKDLMPLYEDIKTYLKGVRDKLRPIYGNLPKSLFHGEEPCDSAVLKGDGHLAGLHNFKNGGSCTCITHFLRVAMQFNENLPEDYPWLAVNNPEVNEQRISTLVHYLKVIDRHYHWSADEIEAFPLIYKLMLFGHTYYYGMLFGIMNNREQLKEMLEFISKQIKTDEIDFRNILKNN